MLAVDCSNYTGTLEPDELARWAAAGYGLVIIQAVDPPPGYPPGVTRQQIEACLAAGFAVDVYVWDWISQGAGDIERKLDLVRPYAGQLRECWVDAEDTAASTPAARQASLREALAVVDRSGIFGRPAGIYTGGWYWRAYMDDTAEFGDRELWDSDYDGIAVSEQSWTPYGGWKTRRIKQWAGTSTLEGVGGVDLNVLSLEEEAQLVGPTQEEPTMTDVDQGWQAKKIGAVEAAGRIVQRAQELEEESRRKTVRRKVLRSLAAGARADAETILA